MFYGHTNMFIHVSHLMNWSVEETEYVLNTVFAKKKKKTVLAYMAVFVLEIKAKTAIMLAAAQGKVLYWI